MADKYATASKAVEWNEAIDRKDKIPQPDLDKLEKKQRLSRKRETANPITRKSLRFLKSLPIVRKITPIVAKQRLQPMDTRKTRSGVHFTNKQGMTCAPVEPGKRSWKVTM